MIVVDTVDLILSNLLFVIADQLSTVAMGTSTVSSSWMLRSRLESIKPNSSLDMLDSEIGFSS